MEGLLVRSSGLRGVTLQIFAHSAAYTKEKGALLLIKKKVGNCKVLRMKDNYY